MESNTLIYLGEYMSKTIEKVTLEDGRVAERHTSVNENGEKVVEVYVEEKKPLKLEKRIVEKTKQVLSEQVVETLQDGQVVDRQVHSIEPNVKLQLAEHIQTISRKPNDYVSKAELADAIVAGVQAAMGSNRVEAQSVIVTKAQQAEMALEQRATTAGNNNPLFYMVAGIILLVQFAFLGYIFIGM
jgi:hypothetical protein